MPGLNFCAEDWLRVQRDTNAWWAGELDRPLVYLAVDDPAVPPPPRQYLSNYPFSLHAEDVVDHYAPTLATRRYYGDAFPWLWINFGPGIMAGFLGAVVHSVSHPSETVWFTPPGEGPESFDRLSLGFSTDSAWWRRIRDVTAAFVARYGGSLQVGCTDLGGNLDILASLRTTAQLLVDVIEQPDEVLKVVPEITKSWLRYYDAVHAIIRPQCPGTSCWTPIWSPDKTYMLQCDFSYMIGPKMFERFVLSDLAACCDHLDHAFYHLDGKGQLPHLNMLLSIPRLRGIQWLPGDGQPSPEQWPGVLKRIRDGGKLCQVFVKPAGALEIVRTLGGKGFLFVILHDSKDFPKPDDAAAFVETLRREARAC